MREPSSPPLSWSRRRFVQGAAAAGLLSPGTLLAQPAPWAQRSAGSPSRLTFVVWQYGKIYEQIAKQFEDDRGVKLNQIIEPNVEPQMAKLTTMFAVGDEVDVSLSPIQYLAGYIQQGIAVAAGSWGGRRLSLASYVAGTGAARASEWQRVWETFLDSRLRPGR